jgi:hypothetical protein
MRRRRRQDEAADDAEDAPETEDSEEPTASDDLPPEAKPAPSQPPAPTQPTSYAVPGLDGAAQSPTPLVTAAGNATSATAPPADGPNLAVIICGFDFVDNASQSTLLMPLLPAVSVVLGFLFIILPLCILLILVVRHRMRRADRRRRKALSREMRQHQDQLLSTKELAEADEWEKAQFGRKSLSDPYQEPRYSFNAATAPPPPPDTGDIADMRRPRGSGSLSGSTGSGRKKKSRSKQGYSDLSASDTARGPSDSDYQHRDESEVHAMLSDLASTARSRSPSKRTPVTPVEVGPPTSFDSSVDGTKTIGRAGSKVNQLRSMYDR